MNKLEESVEGSKTSTGPVPVLCDEKETVYSGLKLVSEAPYRGGTSIKYWM